MTTLRTLLVILFVTLVYSACINGNATCTDYSSSCLACNGAPCGAGLCECNQITSNYTTIKSGPYCNETSCFDILNTSPSVCSGNGNCIYLNVCQCSPQWTGTECSIPLCFGMNATDSSVCSGNGNCTNPDVCSCNSNYVGSKCNLPICYGLDASDPNVCTGHGACIAPNNCSCSTGWSDASCTIPLAPIPQDDYFMVPRGLSAYLKVLDNDTSPAGLELVINFVDSISHSGVALVNTGSTIFYKAIDAAATYLDTFTYTIIHPAGGLSSIVSNVTVFAYNIPPVAVEDAGTVLWNRRLPLTLLSNDYDENPYDHSRLVIGTINQPKNGFVQVDSTQVYTTYIPNTNFVGVDTFSYSVVDPIGAISWANVTINIINNAPVAIPRTFTQHWSTTKVLDILSGSVDPDGDVIFIHNTTALNATISNGKLTFTAGNVLGTQTYSYTITDGNMFSTSTFSVTVTNTAPIATPYTHAIHWRASAIVHLPVLDGAFDADGDSLSIVEVKDVNPLFGTVAINSGILEFTSAKKTYGTTSFTFVVTDGLAFANSTVTLSLSNLNAPVTTPISRNLHWRDFPSRFDVLPTHRDKDADPISLILKSNPNGVVQTIRDNKSGIEYFSLSTFPGLGEFQWNFDATDGSRSVETNCTANVFNNAPTGKHYQISLPSYVAFGHGVQIAPLNDAMDQNLFDVPFLKVVSTSQGRYGTVSLNQDTSIITYNPTTLKNETEVFEYILSDGLFNATYTISINLEFYQDGTGGFYHEQFYVYNHLVAKSGVQVQATEFSSTLWLTGVVVHQPSHGTIRFDAPTVSKGIVAPHVYSFHYNVADYLGYTTTVVQATDGITLGWIRITFLITNLRPIAPTIKLTTHWTDSINFNLLTQSRDPDNDPLSLIQVGTSTCGSLTWNSTAALFTPNGQYIGPDCFIPYTITDGGFTVIGLVDVDVTNYFPLPADPSNSTHWSIHVAGFTESNLILKDIDPDQDSLSLVYIASPIPANSGTSSRIGSSGVTLNALASSTFVDNTLTMVYGVNDGIVTSWGLYSLYIWNTAPTGVADTYSFNGTIPQQSWTLDILKNDFDQDQSLGFDKNLTIVSVDYTGTGKVVIVGGKSLLYTPPSKFVGVDSFTYRITDGMSLSLPTLVSCSILNRPPIGVAEKVNVAWNQTKTIEPLVNDYDINVPPNTPLSITKITSSPVLGSTTFTPNAIYYTSQSRLSYTSYGSVNATLADGFVYRLTNSYGSSSTAPVSVTIYDTRPIATPDTYTLYVTPAPFVATLDILTNDYDADGDILTISGIQSSTGATIQSNKKVVFYTPKTFLGTEKFQYSVSDSQLISTFATVTVNMFPDCFGKHGSDPSLCSGHGNCTAPNVCSCQSTWGNRECQSPICYGVVATSSSVCSSQGTCTGPNTCVCSSRYFTGENCQQNWFVWKGTSGSWSQPSNWWAISDLGWKTATRYPSLNDVVIVNVTGTYTITATNLNLNLLNLTFGGSEVFATLNMASCNLTITEKFEGFSGSIIKNIGSNIQYNNSQISSDFSCEKSGKDVFVGSLIMKGSWTSYESSCLFQMHGNTEIYGKSIIITSNFVFSTTLILGGNSTLKCTNGILPISTTMVESSILMVSNTLILTNQVFTSSGSRLIVDAAGSLTLPSSIQFPVSIECSGGLSLTGDSFKTSSLTTSGNCALNIPSATSFVVDTASLAGKFMTGTGSFQIDKSCTFGSVLGASSQTISVNFNNSMSSTQFLASTTVSFTLPTIMKGMSLVSTSSVTFSSLSLTADVTGNGIVSISELNTLRTTLVITSTTFALAKFNYPAGINFDVTGTSTLTGTTISMIGGAQWFFRSTTTFIGCSIDVKQSTFNGLGNSNVFSRTNITTSGSTFKIGSFTNTNGWVMSNSDTWTLTSTGSFTSGNVLFQNSVVNAANTFSFSQTPVTWNYTSLTCTKGISFSYSRSTMNFGFMNVLTTSSFSFSPSSFNSCSWNVGTTSTFTQSAITLIGNVTTKLTGTSTWSSSAFNSNNSTCNFGSNAQFTSSNSFYIGSSLLITGSATYQTNSQLRVNNTNLYFKSHAIHSSSSVIIGDACSWTVGNYVNFTNSPTTFGSNCKFIVKSYATFTTSVLTFGEGSTSSIGGQISLNASPLYMYNQVPLTSYGLGLFTLTSPLNIGNDSIFRFLQGNCTTGINVCSCNLGYTGVTCQYPICYSKNQTDATACSSNGFCTSPDVCSCYPGWTGFNCSVPMCYGVNSTSPSVCSSNGKCQTKDSCLCNSGWTGQTCSLPICYGVNSTSSSVCSSNGICSTKDNCVCNAGWTGQTCSVPMCFGINSTSSLACSSNGVCSSKDTCTCSSGWTGFNCALPMCYNVNSTSPSVCSTHGSCSSPNNCACQTGWTGFNCQLPICYGTNSTSTSVCSSRGTCVSKDTCTCQAGWTGFNCALPTCYGVNSTSNAVCSSHGSCMGNNICSCLTGWTGQTCSLPICYGLNSTSSTVCSSNGVCSNPNVCTCNPGYTGTTCSFPICFGVNSSSTSVCSSNGACTSKDTCTCNPGYTGYNCQLPICFGVNSTSSAVCSSHGSCASKDSCVCSYGWGGYNCQLPVCFGINSTSETVCSTNGACINRDSCQCAQGWSGLNCQFPMCFGTNSTSTRVCSANGVCNSKDTCQCTGDWFGPSCNCNSTYVGAGGVFDFVTSLQYPYILDPKQIFTVIQSPPGLIPTLSDISDPALCLPNQPCKQKWRIQLLITDACSFTGNYVSKFKLGCHPSITNIANCPLDPNNSDVTIEISANSEDFCTKAKVDIGLTGSLTSFRDSTFQTPQTAFLSKQRAYFLASVESPKASISSAKLMRVEWSQGDATRLLYSNFSITAEGTREELALKTVSPTSASFSFVLDSQLMEIPVDQSAQVKVSATVQVTYAAIDGTTTNDILEKNWSFDQLARDDRPIQGFQNQRLGNVLKISSSISSYLSFAVIFFVALLNFIQ